MNTALWLYRSGLSHSALSAAASGKRVVMSYGELAGRAARIAGALRRKASMARSRRMRQNRWSG